MKKSVMGPDFEKKDAVPPYSESKNAVKLKNRVCLESCALVWDLVICGINYDQMSWPNSLKRETLQQISGFSNTF